jgi:uncharacterized membrane protein YhiD involved in acid resistance
MWVAGAIGVASGLGQYALAAMTTAFALVVLYALRKLEVRLKKRGDAEA